ncbi:MAG: hypothetical protein IM600_10810 [Bacteroidetes bacterium]|nr:hypothetical protein [Bacteroidota bacterium]MCA6443909.1 hypothetical protein [Bacteroidota bacterium]
MLQKNHTTLPYHAFGMEMPGRKWQASNYRYSHNGHEKEEEIFSGAQSAEFWMYDSRIGRRWEIDPVVKPYESPYMAFSGNPIALADPKGLDADSRAHKKAEKVGTEARKIKDGHWVVTEVKTKEIKNSDGSIGVEVNTTEHNYKDNVIDKIGHAVANFFNGAERLRTKAMGSGDNYGVGETWVKGGKIGIKGGFEFNKYAVNLDINLFASDEYSGGLAGEASFEIAGSVRADANPGKPNFLKFQESNIGFVEGYVTGQDTKFDNVVREGGTYTKSRTIAEVEAGVTAYGASVYVKQEADLTTSKFTNSANISYGTKNHNGVKVGIKQKWSAGFSTGEGRLSK